MLIREYEERDEQSWIRCRVISFMDCSYYDDVQNFREKYENPSVRMVVIEDDKVIGFLDCEYECNPGDICYFKGERGGVIWHLGVLPEYRHQHIATKLWEAVKEKLQEKGIKRVEVWTQDDEASNRWYISQGFVFKEAYLNAFIKGIVKDDVIKKYINLKNIGDIFGIRSLNFEAPIERKEELSKICYRLHEVRVFEKVL